MTTTIILTEEQAEERLDKLLPSLLPSHSRSYFQYLFEQQAVSLNQLPIKKRTKGKAGDQLTVKLLPLPEITLAPQDIPLDILYEDQHLIAINKPRGMVVHPAPGHHNNTFVNALLHHCSTLPGSEDNRPGIVHRLDKDTSGVLLAAKTTQTHQRLIEAFSNRQIKKEYLAVTTAAPKVDLIDQPIGRHPIKRKQMTIREDGRPAQTYCTVLELTPPLFLVLLKPITGRTHQLRVHLQAIGVPILGDTLYGSKNINNNYNIHQQLLHAHRLQFSHPITKEPLDIQAPVPPDISRFFQKISCKN